MRFSELALYFQKLEQISSRNSMTEILAELFKKAEASEIDKICYLTQGRVAPLFVALEFGMAEKMIMRAMSQAYGVGEKEIKRGMRDLGDLGKVAEKLAMNSPRPSLTKRGGVIEPSPERRGKGEVITISEVFSVLEEIAHSFGEGSVEKKTKLLSDLLKNVDSLSARYIVRIPLAKMRLGFSEMTVLDALSWMITKSEGCGDIEGGGGSKIKRHEIERAYNVRPDLGFIAREIKSKGLKSLKKLKPKPGTPILMARAERLSSGKEIIEKIGRCAIEPKLDGFRLQVHYGKIKRTHPDPLLRREGDNLSFFPLLKGEGGGEVRLFSRNLEDVTSMYPDIVEAAVSQTKAEEAIFEGEAIGWDEKKQKYLAFQETVQRKRKYDIEAMRKSVPLKLVVFDLLYVDKINMINKTYVERRKRLEEILRN